jgi:hypothetical protein
VLITATLGTIVTGALCTALSRSADEDFARCSGLQIVVRHWPGEGTEANRCQRRYLRHASGVRLVEHEVKIETVPQRVGRAALQLDETGINGI